MGHGIVCSSKPICHTFDTLQHSQKGPLPSEGRKYTGVAEGGKAPNVIVTTVAMMTATGASKAEASTEEETTICSRTKKHTRGRTNFGGDFQQANQALATGGSDCFRRWWENPWL